MLKTRIVTAVIGIPLLLGVLYLGQPYWNILFGIMGVVGLNEYLKMLKNHDIHPIEIPSYLLLLILLFRQQLGSVSLYLLLAFILMIVFLVIQYPRINIADFAFSLMGTVYIGYLLGFAILMADFEKSFSYILLCFLLTWSTDVGGYLFGKLWGKRKMTAQLSPNKTWEGSMGGIILTIITALVFSYFYEMGTSNLAYVLILAFLVSAVAQFGDLFISAIKRFCGVKDAGHIIPGHGGVLDRFDSFILVVPVLYSFIRFMLI
ncbi:MAG: phosphatidate cytidylyltransferase [Bacillota bacterium]|nr:phosphatidate cytidylyltransferase [Bacillota bacterium]